MDALKSYLSDRRRAVDAALRRLLPKPAAKPATLHKAMRYSIFAGGKRLRPILCLSAAECCGGSVEAAMPLACAVECIHTYSLIHDDLPSMDDDDLRRGNPTCHKVYGEAVAILAGDALQALAFELAAAAPPARRYNGARLVTELAVASGSRQLIAGQVLDLEGEGKATLSRRELVAIHERKTAALLGASLTLGAMSANGTPAQMQSVRRFGYALGLAFQIIDDILDVTQTTEKLGKSAGKDEAAQKTTYPSVLGLEKSRREAQRLTRAAKSSLEGLGPRGQRLREIADYMLRRDY